MEWRPFDGGSRVGLKGSEAGVIVMDEEHEAGARITFELACRSAPFAITCGVYGWLVHTRFFADEDEGLKAYAAMKPDLAAIASMAASEDGNSEVLKAIEAFANRFP